MINKKVLFVSFLLCFISYLSYENVMNILIESCTNDILNVPLLYLLLNITVFLYYCFFHYQLRAKKNLGDMLDFVLKISFLYICIIVCYFVWLTFRLSDPSNLQFSNDFMKYYFSLFVFFVNEIIFFYNLYIIFYNS